MLSASLEESKVIALLLSRTGLRLERLAMVEEATGRARAKLLPIVGELLDGGIRDPLRTVLYGAFIKNGVSEYLPRLYGWYASSGGEPDVAREMLEQAIANNTQANDVDATCEWFLRHIEIAQTTALLFLLRLLPLRKGLLPQLREAIESGRVDRAVLGCIERYHYRLFARLDKNK